MRVINYINRKGEPRTVEFMQVINQWIQRNGGITQVTRDISNMSVMGRESIQIDFIKFFLYSYDCTLPDEGSDLFQPELFDSAIFHQAIFNVQYEHNTRPTSGYNIAFLVICALAILGLIKMCS